MIASYHRRLSIWGGKPPRHLSQKTVDDIARICATVARFNQVAPESIFAPIRPVRVVRARQLAMTIIRDSLHLSTTEVGRLFSRGHDTVIHASSVIHKVRKSDPKINFLYLSFLSESSL